jgi:hypothetical protein
MSYVNESDNTYAIVEFPSLSVAIIPIVVFSANSSVVLARPGISVAPGILASVPFSVVSHC